jgi:type IX secretion system PorP/SprF family membrane protein
MFFLNSNLLFSQDMHFTQFYSSSLYLNPAFAGANVCSRVTLTYRDQWPGVSKAYKTFLASYDHYLTKYNLGLGIVVGSDVAGTGQLRTTILNPIIAYEAKLTKKLFLRIGTQTGIGIKSINYNNLVFGDQIARGGGVPTIEEPTQTKLYFDVGAGALLYSKKIWAGISFYHLNRPNETLLGQSGTSNLPIKYSIHTGYKIILNPEEKDVLKQRYLSPAFNFRGQKEFDQMDIGCYYSRDIYNLGLWYRGIPGYKPYKTGYRNDDAICIVFGIRTERINFGYSYDITISKLTNNTHGAQEITISYQLCKLNKKKKKPILVPCPKF